MSRDEVWDDQVWSGGGGQEAKGWGGRRKEGGRQGGRKTEGCSSSRGRRQD